MNAQPLIVSSLALAMLQAASPAQADGPAATPRTVSVAQAPGHGLAALSDGSVLGWGEACAAAGVAPRGDTPLLAQPTPVPGVSRALQVAAGSGYSAALLDDGSVRVWGRPDSGRLGIGALQPPGPACIEPRRLRLAGVKQLAGGTDHVLALLADGSVAAFGSNHGTGALGDGTEVARLAPVAVALLRDIVQVAATEGRSYARQSDGRVWQWGRGLGPMPRPVQGLPGRAVQLAVGGDGVVTAEVVAPQLPGPLAHVIERRIEMRLIGPVAIDKTAAVPVSGRMPAREALDHDALAMGEARYAK